MALTSGRTLSLASSTLLGDEPTYDRVDEQRLYELVLKVLLVDYVTEARFRTPMAPPLLLQGPNGVPASRSRHLRPADADIRLPPQLVGALEAQLNLVAMKRAGNSYDDNTRRSLLRLYSELLDPAVKADLARANNPEYLVMRFVSCANKELLKMGVDGPETARSVFVQASTFVQILIGLLQKEKNADAIVVKLEEHKELLNPHSKAKTGLGTSLSELESVQFLQPSFRASDMDRQMVELVERLFLVLLVKLQQDIFRLKDLAREKTLHRDIQQVSFYLGKDLGQCQRASFCSDAAYAAWKKRESKNLDELAAKYPVPAAQKLLPTPPLPSGEDFYVFPSSHLTRVYFVTLAKLCLLQQRQEDSTLAPDRPLFSKQATHLLTTCARFWRIDWPARAVCLYLAGHLSGALKDGLLEDSRELRPVDLDATTVLLHTCKKIVEDSGGLEWDDRLLWASKDQDEWVKNLIYSYNETLFAIKELLSMIFNTQVKPKFGPYLAFLGDYLESDALFSRVEDTGLQKKWEKKLSKALLRISESRYADLLANLPRDDTLSVIHILDISDNIVKDIKQLQKRYKNPLLGFLNVSRTVAAVVTAMFASDAKNILKHIDAYVKNRGEFMAYGDALEAYRSLSEIRDIFQQVLPAGQAFKFRLEDFFYPFLEAWVAESGEKIGGIIEQAIEKDNLEPIDIESADKKYSRLVLDVFTLVKEFLRILSGLNWANEGQTAKAYTALLKSISDGVLYYLTTLADKIMKDLDEEEQKKLLEAEEAPEKRKSANWFDEVKNAVSSLQNASKALLEEYNFKPETCVALNNISAMQQQLTKLEDLLDPELISNTVTQIDPDAQKKYTSHIFLLRMVRAENLKLAASSSDNMHPYLTVIDTKARKTVGKTRTVHHSCNPEWDEEFEVTLPANTSLTLSTTVWDERMGTHSVCGRALIQLDPRRFKHDGIPQEIYLDLDTQGRVLVEVAVESERIDAIFVMGRAHRALQRSQQRIIKLVVEKFLRFIHYCFSRANLRSICGSNGLLKPSQQQVDDAMTPLYDYLNMNLLVLAQYLSTDLLLQVMVAAWRVVLQLADDLLLPKLTSAKTFQMSNLGAKLKATTISSNGWQLAVTSAVANVTGTMGISGFGKSLTPSELETVFSWLNYLCFDFFHNDGNGPPVKDLKNEHYQALLLIPVYYDRDVTFLKLEVERLSPAFVQSLRDRNNFDFHTNGDASSQQPARKRSRALLVVRHKTIAANATARSRARAQKEAQEARTDSVAAQNMAEDIILRLLLIKDEKSYVARRLEQRERLAHSIATERLARAAAEGRFSSAGGGY